MKGATPWGGYNSTPTGRPGSPPSSSRIAKLMRKKRTKKYATSKGQESQLEERVLE